MLTFKIFLNFGKCNNCTCSKYSMCRTVFVDLQQCVLYSRCLLMNLIQIYFCFLNKIIFSIIPYRNVFSYFIYLLYSWFSLIWCTWGNNYLIIMYMLSFLNSNIFMCSDINVLSQFIILGLIWQWLVHNRDCAHYIFL